MTLKRHFDV